MSKMLNSNIIEVSTMLPDSQIGFGINHSTIHQINFIVDEIPLE